MNVLLAEDEHVSRTRLAKFLRKLGHQVVECQNGYEALKQFEVSEIQMVLSDIKMPKMSGIELLREIKTIPTGRDVNVILFTGHGDVQLAIEALRGGAYDYLLKPININDLAVLTEHVAEHQAFLLKNKVLTENFEDVVKAATEETMRELSHLEEAYARVMGFEEIGFFSQQIRNVLQQAYMFHTDRSIPVLIQGETGTGKEVIARYIHFGVSGTVVPFVDINCAAIAQNIFESELFGYEAGAFTGGLPGGQKGKLDLAKGGTIFFDEITELPIKLQAKLLRVIQEKEFYRVGGLKKIKTDVRIICATNVEIQKEVEKGTFRRDLYYRLNVGHIIIPPLRDRTEEILPLANLFLKGFVEKRKKHFGGISDEAANILLSHNWPGNIRELRNVIEWATFIHDDIELKPSHLGNLLQLETTCFIPEHNPVPEAETLAISLPSDGFNLEKHIDRIVLEALEMHKGNKSKTARYLGITRRSLCYRLERLG